jgi:hypothetical protein
VSVPLSLAINAVLALFYLLSPEPRRDTRDVKVR